MCLRVSVAFTIKYTEQFLQVDTKLNNRYIYTCMRILSTRGIPEATRNDSDISTRGEGEDLNTHRMDEIENILLIIEDAAPDTLELT